MNLHSNAPGPVLLGKSVRGASHIRSGAPCQDSWQALRRRDGLVLLTVADGHGSAACPHSGEGARLATQVFCDVLSRLSNRFAGQPESLYMWLCREGSLLLPRDLDHEWKRRVEARHLRRGRPLPRGKNGETDRKALWALYGTTLLGLLLARDFLFAFQLGDGDICLLRPDRVVKILDPEKMLGVETHSLSRENAWEKAVTAVRRFPPDFTGPALFTLSTDGLANSYPGEAAFHAALADYFRVLREHGAAAVRAHLASWLSETSALGCGDDITFLLAWAPDPVFPPPAKRCGLRPRHRRGLWKKPASPTCPSHPNEVET